MAIRNLEKSDAKFSLKESKMCNFNIKKKNDRYN